jgi:hypothetical protein
MRSRQANRSRSRSKPQPRLTFDAAFFADIEAITKDYLATHGTGPMSSGRGASPEIHITLPDGRHDEGRLRSHGDAARRWFEGFLAAALAADRDRDDQLNADGSLPAVRPEPFDLWPCQIKLKPTPWAGKGADYAGAMWLSSRDGGLGGQVYFVVGYVQQAGELLLKGEVTPFRKVRR